MTGPVSADLAPFRRAYAGLVIRWLKLELLAHPDAGSLERRVRYLQVGRAADRFVAWYEGHEDNLHREEMT